jgi:hypothetical protein
MDEDGSPARAVSHHGHTTSPGSAHRTTPRQAQTDATRPDVARHRLAREAELSRREGRERLVAAKRMRVQGSHAGTTALNRTGPRHTAYVTGVGWGRDFGCASGSGAGIDRRRRGGPAGGARGAARRVSVGVVAD